MSPVAQVLIAYFIVCALVSGAYVVIAWRTGRDPS